MVERRLVLDHLKLSYEGLFKASELYALIQSFFFEKGWDWYEQLNQEQITPDGKQIKIILHPWKASTDYHKISMKIKILMVNVKDVEVEHENKKLKMDHGVIRMTFDGFVLSDRNGKWTNKPFLWFLSIIFERCIFKSDFEQLETWIKSDVDDLHGKIKSYLNVMKYTYQQ